MHVGYHVRLTSRVIAKGSKFEGLCGTEASALCHVVVTCPQHYACLSASQIVIMNVLVFAVLG